MSFALLATKCSDAIRLKFILEDSLWSSQKKKTPLDGAAFTLLALALASFTPSP